ncbi:efflux RND transporter periplasmic adaptor subunit [Pseudooceanicola sediminis]|uniref:Efflux RND transporter periplasmic adaptor subunit n=1 Tax=Pseudooceanicola sediminis TaxID=2211117 RepID=A0A399JB73_9RHOB|nr:efflux RND transporter periplasmic adaptor subunit [Pseudooceanicola sediminis]KAA2314247.1 efflux RND transporter periplasmic adaptor subunit [Puniceibacterium sp. HSS470]RII39896.1 efflux RND transporter periplasmic adaptor subunit [Pseudooceanicola sediminis]|tara:strand:+ start:45090 stop:46325 length:1236 start_codon:yes stop_codon:yes gene_type:complete
MVSEKPDTVGKPDWALSGRERKAAERAKAGLPPRKRRGWLIVIVLVLIAAAALWWMRSPSATPDAEQAEAGTTQTSADVVVMQIMPSELMTIEPRLLRETVKVTGSLAPQRQLHLSAEVSGRVEDVTGREGDAVQAGQELIQIDIETLTNQLEQQRASAEATRAQLRLAQNQLERTQSLVNRGLTPSSELEAGQANVDQLAASLAAQEKQVESAENSLGHARVTAPFDAMISERSVDPGAYVGIGSALMSLVDLSHLEFEATVPVRYAASVKRGLEVELTVEGVGSVQFQGAVERINPVAISGSRMLPIYVGIDNSDGLLRGGMFASGRLVLEEKPQAIGVPYDAVYTDDAGRYVFKRDGDTVIRQAVEVAREWDGGRIVEIASGLAPGDVIISQPLQQLRAGASISVVGE